MCGESFEASCDMNGDATRREFLHGGAVATAGLLAKETAAVGQEPNSPNQQPHAGHDSTVDYPRDRPSTGGPVGSATDRGMLVPGLGTAGKAPVPVIVPDLSEKVPWKLVDGVKEFHLYCRHTRREVLPDLYIDVWGFNDLMPGPTIEVMQGDRVRIWVHNDLPESTGIHWHGLEIPVAMDGVPGLTQPPIPPGGLQAYEFTLHQTGTFFYHSHDAMQDGMGMVGLFLIHPKQAHEPRVDRDFALIDPGMGDSPRQHHPEHDVDGVQPVHLERPGCAVRHPPGMQAGRARADSAGEFQRHRSSPDAPSRPDILGHGHGRGPNSSPQPGFPATPCWWAWRRCAKSSSSPITLATGCCIATCSTT